MVKFVTERLLIRELVDDDIDDLYSLLSDPAIMQYCSGAMDRKGATKWLESVKKYYDKYGYDYWVAIDKETREFVGQLGIIKQEVDGQWLDCVAFMISKDKWRMGYATEGAKGCIGYAKDALDIQELYATVEKENIDSQAVFRKIGMTYVKDAVCFGDMMKLFSIKA